VAIRRMHCTCWIPNVTETHSEYVILIVFPLHQWFRECTSVLHHMYIACLISFLVGLLLPTLCRCRGLLLRIITLSDTHTLGRAPLDERSVRRRDLYLTKQCSQQTDIHAHGGIRTRNPSKRATTDPHLRPRGHRNRPLDHSTLYS